MSLKIYNVLTRTKEVFKPIEEGHVGIYVCGPTVYDHPHFGHAKNYVGFDVVVRYLRYLGYKVLYVQNITDVGHLVGDRDEGEDKIQKRAKREAVLPMQLVETYMRIFFENMDALNVQRPDISPRAAGHVPEQIEMVQELIEKGHAYESNGSVYFDVSSWPEYGKLSGRKVADQEEGARLEINEEKRHPSDFALWKHADPEHLMQWHSPWGMGYPGWHVECSAMARKYLGKTFDIHGGGIDNMFPHNECEIAQSEAAHDGETFANYWMLSGSLTLDGVKMGKSLGNSFTVSEALEKNRPEAIRMFILSSKYRNPIDFSDDALDSAETGWNRLWNTVSELRKRIQSAPVGEETAEIEAIVQKIIENFEKAMNDDFNAPAAVAVIQELATETNKILNNGSQPSRGSLQALDNAFRALGGNVLAIIPDEAAGDSASVEREDGLIRLLIEMRANARKNKDWATSDRIRDELKELGVQLLDGATGTTWQLA